MGKKIASEQDRFNESRSKLNMTFMTEVSQMSQTQAEDMAKHEERRKKREDKFLDKLQTRGRDQMDRTA